MSRGQGRNKRVLSSCGGMGKELGLEGSWGKGKGKREWSKESVECWGMFVVALASENRHGTSRGM